MNTIPPNDFSFYEMLNEVVQQEPATALDPELMGPLAAIGIVKGKPFAPDARMKKILTEALAVANADARAACFMNPRDAELVLLSRLGLDELPVRQRLRVRDADPDDHARGRQAVPAHRRTARSMRARRSSTASPASRRRWPCACPASARSTSSRSLDADKQYFDGAKTYKVTLPKGIPEAKFWSFTLYDNQTRSMLDTPQRYPARRQPELSRRPPPNRTPTARRRSTSARRSPMGSSAATGSRPCRARAGSRSCASTARSSRSSQGVAAERDRGRSISVRALCIILLIAGVAPHLDGRPRADSQALPVSGLSA